MVLCGFPFGVARVVAGVVVRGSVRGRGVFKVADDCPSPNIAVTGMGAGEEPVRRWGGGPIAARA